MFADGAGPLSNNDNVESTVGESGGGGGSKAPWGMRTVASPIDSIVAGEVIVVAIVIIVVLPSAPPLPSVPATHPC